MFYYDDKGQRQTIWYGNSTKTKYSYDPLNYRLTRLCTVNLNPTPHIVLQDQYYWYDAVGNITRIKDEAEDPVFWGNTVIDPVKLYTYDALYRLTEARGREQAGNHDYLNDNYEDVGGLISPINPHSMRNYTQIYTYDAVGNMLELHHNAGAGTYIREFSYIPGTNRLDKTRVDAIDFRFTYDARGNVLGMAHINGMSWNSQNQLGHIARGTSMSAYYQYSAGQRIRKVVEKGITTEERIYLGGFEIYRKKVSGVLQVERITVHISNDTGRIAMLEVRTEGDALDDHGTPAKLQRFIYSNHLQSSGLELDEAGEIISYEEYHPYGTTAYQAMASTIKATAKRYRFTGKERDEESGLNYHGARYYAPWLCRWISVDPINSEWYNARNGNPGRNKKRKAEEMGAASYEYCYDNPVMFTDSTGEQPPVERMNEVTVTAKPTTNSLIKSFAKGLLIGLGVAAALIAVVATAGVAIAVAAPAFAAAAAASSTVATIGAAATVAGEGLLLYNTVQSVRGRDLLNNKISSSQAAYNLGFGLGGIAATPLSKPVNNVVSKIANASRNNSIPRFSEITMTDKSKFSEPTTTGAPGFSEPTTTGLPEFTKPTVANGRDIATKIENHRRTANAGVRGNYGYITGEIGGVNLDGIVRSGSPDTDIPQIFEALSINSQQVVNGEGAWIRSTDSEYKILNRIANKLGAERGRVYSDVSGEVTLASEREICVSCEGVIQQFRTMFPNIKVNIINETKY